MRRLLTPGWLAGHLAVWLMVAAFAALGWWQAGRAADGNLLSWAYTFEWPLFAIFVIVLWIREMRQTLRRDRPEVAPGDSAPKQPIRRPVITRRATTPAVVEDDSDPRLAAYNRYLAWLNEHPTAKHSDYPAKEFSDEWCVDPVPRNRLDRRHPIAGPDPRRHADEVPR